LASVRIFWICPHERVAFLNPSALQLGDGARRGGRRFSLRGLHLRQRRLQPLQTRHHVGLARLEYGPVRDVDVDDAIDLAKQ
jgi:hypothetical protein